MQFLAHTARSLVAATLLTSFALAHDPGISSSTITRGDGAQLTVDLRIDDLDLAEIVRIDTDDDGRASAAEVAEHEDAIRSALSRGFTLANSAGHLALSEIRIDVDENDDVRFVAKALQNEVGGSITFDLELLRGLPRGHRHLCRVLRADGSIHSEALLHSGQRRLVVSPQAEGTSAWSRFVDFIVLGVEHILIGWDHLAFVMLLLIGVSLKGGVVLLSAFTLAHSITLGLATMQIVRVPTTLVEIAIAASIAVLAWQNLRRGNAPEQQSSTLRIRTATSFALGLLHGFGFASVLSDFLPSSGVLLPLLGFNVGVELGQIAVGAAFCAVLAILARLEVTRRMRIAPVINVSALLLGLFWVLERSAL